jgi:hypothetical protein
MGGLRLTFDPDLEHALVVVRYWFGLVEVLAVVEHGRAWLPGFAGQADGAGGVGL